MNPVTDWPVNRSYTKPTHNYINPDELLQFIEQTYGPDKQGREAFVKDFNDRVGFKCLKQEYVYQHTSGHLRIPAGKGAAYMLFMVLKKKELIEQQSNNT